MCRFECRIISSFDIARVTVPEQVMVHLVRPRCVVGSVEPLCWKRARHGSIHRFFLFFFVGFFLQVVLAAESFSTLALWYHVKSNVRKPVWRQNDKEENAGLMESLGLRSIRGRDWEWEREKTQELCSKRYSISMQHTIHTCVQWTRFIQVLEGLTEVP